MTQYATTLDEVLALRSENANLRAQVNRMRDVVGRAADLPHFKNERMSKLVRDAVAALGESEDGQFTGADIRAYQEQHEVGFYEAKAMLMRGAR